MRSVLHRKGVSPVIAVILLIALTVAAVAIIWPIVSNLIGGVTHVEVQTIDVSTNGNNATWYGHIKTSQGGDLSFTLVNSTSQFSGSVSDSSIVANSEKSFNVVFDGNIKGSFTLEIALSVDGDLSFTSIDVNF